MAVSRGAAGLLVADWGDHGHWQPISISYLGLTCGAAAAWNTKSPIIAPDRCAELLPRALDAFVFRDAAGVLGRVVYTLGNAYLVAPRKHTVNMTWLFQAVAQFGKLCACLKITLHKPNALPHCLLSLLLPMQHPSYARASRTIWVSKTFERHAS